MLKTIHFFVVAFAVSTVTYTGNADAISIDFVPNGSIVSVGSTVTLDVKISGLGDQTLSAYDLGVFFDPNYLDLSVDGVSYGDPTFGDQLDLSESGSLTSTTPGVLQGSLVEVRFAEVSLASPSVLNSLQKGDFILARLGFLGKGIGTSPVTFGIHDLIDAADNSIPATTDITLGSASIQVVPEPGTGLLLSAGLFAYLRKKSRKL